MEDAVGQIEFKGRGPYYLPPATHASAQRGEEGIIVSFRLWKSEIEWTLVRVQVTDEEADKLVDQIRAARARQAEHTETLIA
jgi:hypothetical protein